MGFYRIKTDKNDILFSQLIRFGKILCDRCGKERKLQCAHIFSRGFWNTRFDEKNAIALCSTCHDWFDTHKIRAVLLDERKRVFSSDDESYTFLVKRMGRTWDDLLKLYAKANIPYSGYSYKKEQINLWLRERLAEKRGETV